MVILVVAIVDFMSGTFIGPKSDEERAKGFVGYDSEYFHRTCLLGESSLEVNSRKVYTALKVYKFKHFGTGRT